MDVHVGVDLCKARLDSATRPRATSPRWARSMHQARRTSSPRRTAGGRRDRPPGACIEAHRWFMEAELNDPDKCPGGAGPRQPCV
jgi:hypothetical protein